MLKMRLKQLLLIAIFLCSLGTSASGTLLPITDIASLIYLSPEIVEGEIVAASTGDPVAHELDRPEAVLIDVKVATTYKGQLKPDDVLSVTCTCFFRKPRAAPVFQPVPLAVGDKLILFLKKTKGEPRDGWPVGNQVYCVVESGMRLIEDDKVFDFDQPINPGDYVARPEADFPNKQAAEVDVYRKRLRVAIDEMQQTLADLDAKNQPSDSPWLIEFIQRRSKTPDGHSWPVRDYPTEIALARLANWHDTKYLTQALPYTKSTDRGWRILVRGFGTPSGRDFLMKTIEDPNEATEKRIDYLRYLRQAGYVHDVILKDINAESEQLDGKAGQENAHLLTRLARLARRSRNNDEFCLELVESLDSVGSYLANCEDPEFQRNARTAFEELLVLYQANPPERAKYEIEKNAVQDPSSYRQLHSECGNVISLLTPSDRQPSEMHRLKYVYTFNTALCLEGITLKPSVVLENLKLKKEYVLPSGLEFQTHCDHCNEAELQLPDDLPRGKYRAFFRFSDGSGDVSNGHSFDADL